MRLSLQLKLVVAVLALALLTAVVSARLTASIFESKMDGAAVAALRLAAESFAGQEQSETEKLSATLDAVLANDAYREAFLAGDRARLLAATAPLLERLRERDRITHWYFVTAGPTPTVFLRVHKPEMFGDSPRRETLRRAIASGDIGAGKELGKTAFALRVVRPWVHEGRVIGYVELAQKIDHFLATLKSRTGDEYGLLVQKRYLDEQAWAQVLGSSANTWNDRQDVVVVDTTTFTEGIVDFDGDLEAVPDRGLVLGQQERADRTFVRGIFPLRDAAGRKVGGLFVLHDFTAQDAAIQAGALQSFLVLLGIGALLALLIAFAARWIVFRRLDSLRERLEAQAAAQGLAPGRIVHVSDDEVTRIEILVDRALYPRRQADAEREPPPRQATAVSQREG